MSWNDVQAEVFLLFRQLTGMTLEHADAVFFAIRTDAAQRDMTAALASVVLKNEPDILKELLSLINGLGKLAAQRNLAVHTAWFIDEGSEQPEPYMRYNKPKSLEPDAIAQFTRLYAKLQDLHITLYKFRKTHATLLNRGHVSRGRLMASLQANALLSSPQNTESRPEPSPG